MIVIVVLDVTHKEGQDNLLYAYPRTENNRLLALRGIVGASAGAATSLFNEPMQLIEFSTNCFVAQVDLGHLLFALISEDEASHNVLNNAVKNCYQLLQSAFGPPGLKCIEWKKQYDLLDDLIQRWLNVFMNDKVNSALHHLFKESIPKSLPSCNLLVGIMELCGDEYLDCAKINPQHAGMVLFYKKQLIVSGFNPSSTFLLYQWMMVSMDIIGNNEAPVAIEKYETLLERIEIKFGQEIKAPLPPDHPRLNEQLRIVAHNKYHQTIVDNLSLSLSVDNINFMPIFTKTISRMQKRYDIYQTLHGIRTAPFIEHPKAPIADDPYILRVINPLDSNGQEVGSGQSSIFPTQYSIYRPESYFAQLLHKQATRVRLPNQVRIAVVFVP
ncbi:hypothetical protein THRCLA_20491 [Thraustotheca clavata]|uniref:CCZ1/INTU/HSP4 first Longin domain-containing protein n=1 Tax=Thraustotheca clavata TaxID=74557 RepID=A0A1W0A6K1_9STRA|nr:hypothetical protein THRCLA_20491 [Thraustotheca clavata]